MESPPTSAASPRLARPDIGAFQSQGFSSRRQPAARRRPDAGTRLRNPLAVTVTANNPDEPVAGGVVTFAVNPASRRLGQPVRRDSDHRSNGIAGVTATANSVAGSYTVAASTGDVGDGRFALTNLSRSPFRESPTRPFIYGTRA